MLPPDRERGRGWPESRSECGVNVGKGQRPNLFLEVGARHIIVGLAEASVQS
jgi:hypothetical protein